jgi:hypothetical protein
MAVTTQVETAMLQGRKREAAEVPERLRVVLVVSIVFWDSTANDCSSAATYQSPQTAAYPGSSGLQQLSSSFQRFFQRHHSLFTAAYSSFQQRLDLAHEGRYRDK